MHPTRATHALPTHFIRKGEMAPDVGPAFKALPLPRANEADVAMTSASFLLPTSMAALGSNVPERELLLAVCIPQQSPRSVFSSEYGDRANSRLEVSAG